MSVRQRRLFIMAVSAKRENAPKIIFSLLFSLGKIICIYISRLLSSDRHGGCRPSKKADRKTRAVYDKQQSCGCVAGLANGGRRLISAFPDLSELNENKFQLTSHIPALELPLYKSHKQTMGQFLF